MQQLRTLAILLGFTTMIGTAHAGLGDWLGVLKESVTVDNPASRDVAVSTLTNSDMASALKQALDKGVQRAVSQLGQPGGFLNNARVRIPIPDRLAWAETTLRRVGQGKIVDDFIASMNGAAEKAVPQVASVFGEAIRNMSLEDAKAILQGPDDAATQFFRKNSSEKLSARILPIVRDATSATGVTASYKRLLSSTGGLSYLFDPRNVDVDRYITDRAMGGLFLMIAEEERKIRENPLERSTALMKKVFGAF